MPILVLFLSYFSGLIVWFPGNYYAVNAKARDTERKTDIHAMHAQLEVYYAEYGYYPDSESFAAKAPQLLRGLSEDALLDPNGTRINQGGDYTYRAIGCVSTQCQMYILSAKLDNDDIYSKESLN